MFYLITIGACSENNVTSPALEIVDDALIEQLPKIKNLDPDREALLTRIISNSVLPVVLSQTKHLAAVETGNGLHPSLADIDKLTTLILGPDNSDALEFIYTLRRTGISLDILHLELLEPAARQLGTMWDEDRVDFFSVAIAINKLQRIVHHFADLNRIQPYDSKRRALIMVAPGEDHSFGNQLVQKFLRAAGWYVLTLTGKEQQKVQEIAAQEWLAVVGISISTSAHLSDLKALIGAIREKSLNRNIGIMIGGPLVSQRPELVECLKVDGTAANAASAVILAKKLLAEGLIANAEAI